MKQQSERLRKKRNRTKPSRARKFSSLTQFGCPTQHQTGRTPVLKVPGTDGVLDEMMVRLGRLYAEDRGPFPYDGCRAIRATKAGSSKRYEDLIPDLDSYFSYIAGSCSWGCKVLDWPSERMRETLHTVRRSFFEVYPNYRPLRLQVKKRTVPDLYRDLKLHDKMRVSLVELLIYLLADAEDVD